MTIGNLCIWKGSKKLQFLKTGSIDHETNTLYHYYDLDLYFVHFNYIIKK